MIYAIGDVQGCYDELQLLLETFNFDPASDQLWFTGDIVNRGPQSLATIRFIKSLSDRAITVLGNHELHMLAVVLADKEYSKHDTFQEIEQAEDRDELFNWLLTCPFLYQASNFVLVHAGIVPQWDIQQAQQYANELSQQLQNNTIPFLRNMYGNNPLHWSEDLTDWQKQRYMVNAFTRLRFCQADGALDLVHKGNMDSVQPPYYPWFNIEERKTKDEKILFGHWASLKGITNNENVFALDTGCAWGEELTAMCLETQQRFSVTKS